MEKAFLSYDKDVSFLSNIKVDEKLEIMILYTHFMKKSCNKMNFEPHTHSFFELHIVLNGECVVNLKNKDISMQKNSYILIPTGMKHNFLSCSEDFFRYSLAFDIIYKENPLPHTDEINSGTLSESGIEHIKSILYEYENNKTGFGNIINSRITCLLTELLRETEFFCSKEPASSSVSPVLHKAICFIEKNISHKLKLSEVAAEVFLSPRQLNRIFSRNLSMTVSEYIRLKKIKLIKEYLKKTDLPLKEIARLSGLEDPSALCRFFKRETGVSAGDYRALPK